MANTSQQKFKPSTYTGTEPEAPVYSDNRIQSVSTPVTSDSSSWIYIVAGVLVLAALAFFFLSGDTVTETPAPATTTQETAPVQTAPPPAPSDPVQPPVADPPAVTPEPAPAPQPAPAPAPQAPAN